MQYIITLSKNFQQILICILLLLSIYYIINIGNKHVHINKKLSLTKGTIIIVSFVILMITLFYNIFSSHNIVREVIVLTFYSIIFSYILNPIINYIEEKGIKRAYGILIVYTIIIAIFSLILFTLVPKVTNEFGNLLELIPTYTNDIYNSFNSFYLEYTKKIEKLPPSLSGINVIFFENLRKIESHLLNYLRSNISSITNSIANSIKLLIVPIISFYLLKDKEYFKKKILLIIPVKIRANINSLCRKIDNSLISFLKGQIITSVIVGILSIIALSIIKIEFAILIGLIIAIFEIVPYLGPLVGIVLTIVFGLIDSPTKAIWGVLLLFIIQQIENSIIAPKIVGESVGLNPVVIIISVIIGAGYFGLLGMILAVPVVSVVKILSSFILDKVSEK